MDTDNPVVNRLIKWGEKRDDVRAIILSSSRTNPTIPHLVDALSDYDLDVVITGDVRAWWPNRNCAAGGTTATGCCWTRTAWPPG